MKINKIAKHGLVLGFLATAMIMPISDDVNATSSLTSLDSYHPYPLPDAKPVVCTAVQESEHETYINEKQAVAAALGLYLGIKQATAPQVMKDSEQTLCV